jgi:Arc/MetJ-type ribon-helix-helix transcriptional regulator
MMKHADPNSLLVTLPADQMERLNELVESGEYASKDEVILDALRLWEERHVLEESAQETAWLKREHEEGLASGLAEDLTKEERLAQFKAEFQLRG